MEAQEVQTKTWLAAAARIELRDLFCVRDRLCDSHAHVGSHRVPAAVLFWLWVHGNLKPVTDCRRQAFGFFLAKEQQRRGATIRAAFPEALRFRMSLTSRLSRFTLWLARQVGFPENYRNQAHH